MALRTADGGTISLGTFRLEEDETMFILGRALGSGLTAHVIGGEQVLQSAAGDLPEITPSEAAPIAESSPPESGPSQ